MKYSPKVKSRLNILIDSDLILKLREKRINASEICNRELWKAVDDPATIEARAKVEDKAREKMLRQFLSLDPRVVENEPAMDYWSDQLGIPVEELIALRKKEVTE